MPMYSFAPIPTELRDSNLHVHVYAFHTEKKEQHDTNKIRGVFYLLVCLFLFVVVVFV